MRKYGVEDSEEGHSVRPVRRINSTKGRVVRKVGVRDSL